MNAKRLLKNAAVTAGVVATIVTIWRALPVWHHDADGDGYGDPSVSIRIPWQPDGYVSNSDDCFEANAKARPGIDTFYTTDRGDGSFDYDCNGESDRQYATIGACDGGNASPEGWNGSTVPACGAESRWLWDCDRRLRGLPPSLETVRETVARTQACR